MKMMYSKFLLMGLSWIMVSQVFGQNKPFPAELKMVSNWSASNVVQSFDAETLYDHINGASDFYLSYHFKQLWVVEYSNLQQQMLTLEIYEHADNNCAFGIYVEERPTSVDLLGIGAQGFWADGAAYFLSGKYYVKVFSGNPAPTESELTVFAKNVAEFLSSENVLPKQMALFPTQNVIDGSERYTAENFLGREGFNEVFTKGYTDGAQNYKLFVVSGSANQIETVLNSYLASCGAKRNANDVYRLKDKYNGPVYLQYKNGVMAGVIEHPKPTKVAVSVEQLILNSANK